MQRIVSEAFPDMLAAKQAAIQPGVDIMTTQINNIVTDQPEPVRESVYAVTDVMSREGSKRIRPILFETGYRIFGGQDTETIGLGAGILEAIHTNLLVMDDTHDSSDTRRGGAAAHVIMGGYLKDAGIGRSPEKLGTDTALTAGFILHTYASEALGRLAIPGDHMRHVSSIINRSLVQTGIGQLRDLTPNPEKPPTPAEVLETYRLKTGIYTYNMSLGAGGAAVGAKPDQVELFLPYAENAGIAFQLQDDILGVTAKSKHTGKPQNDIIEGKRTWLVVTALERAGARSRQFLAQSLGNTALTAEDLNQCTRILEQTEAIADAQTLVGKYTNRAVNALDAAPYRWPVEQVTFLRDLAIYGATRQK